VQWLTNEDNKDFPKVMKAEEKKKADRSMGNVRHP